jgi:uncharacterized protein with HEPN domain
MKDDRLYLVHICESIDRILRYTSDGKEFFLSDTLIQDAVLRNLHTLSESTQRISEGVKSRRPEIDWKAISGFRNILVHDYLGLNLIRVWEVIDKDLPKLRGAAAGMLNELGGMEKPG